VVGKRQGNRRYPVLDRESVPTGWRFAEPQEKKPE
jgi:hypothetical protein